MCDRLAPPLTYLAFQKHTVQYNYLVLHPGVRGKQPIGLMANQVTRWQGHANECMQMLPRGNTADAVLCGDRTAYEVLLIRREQP